ncbi:YopX family protein [Chryseobacterium sp. G0240]|uniref:YopX family protein n=1 Tax=Chryseobacterium sp. G0240 TaxID=2487066 RepID=UPI003977B46A
MSIDNKAFTYEVKYEYGCFIAYHLLKKYLGIWGPVYKFAEKDLEIEVIGNIYDNPELLK